MSKHIKSAAFVPSNTVYRNRSLTWALDGLVAMGDVAMVSGPKGACKSQLAAHLAAVFTTSKPFAPSVLINPSAIGRVMLFNGERAVESFAYPRCQAAGADMSKVDIRKRAHIDEIISVIEAAPLDVKGFLVDPLKSSIDVSRIGEERARFYLDRLALLAADRNAAVILFHHITLKGAKSDEPTDYIQGRRIWVEYPLTSLMVCPLAKGFILENVASNKLKGQRYEYESETVVLPDGVETERIVIIGEGKQPIIEALKGAASKMSVVPVTTRVEIWLLDFLKDGEKTSNEIEEAGAVVNITKKQLTDAKIALGPEGAQKITRRKQTGVEHGPWLWTLGSLEAGQDYKTTKSPTETKTDNGPKKLRRVRVSLAEAHAFTDLHHRHLEAARINAKFAIGLRDEAGELVAVITAGRPSDCKTDQDAVIELSRVVTREDYPAPNAASILISAATRMAKALGCARVQSFTLPDEDGTTYKASGFAFDGWTKPSGRLNDPHPIKGRWVKMLKPEWHTAQKKTRADDVDDYWMRLAAG